MSTSVVTGARAQTLSGDHPGDQAAVDGFNHEAPVPLTDRYVPPARVDSPPLRLLIDESSSETAANTTPLPSVIDAGPGPAIDRLAAGRLALSVSNSNVSAPHR